MASLRACALLVLYSTFILFTSAKSIEMTGNDFFFSVDPSSKYDLSLLQLH
jgi:hypothetical protein